MSVEQRDRWPEGIVRHLRLDADASPHFAHAMRVEQDSVYTLVLHPKLEDCADRFRSEFEGSPALGGLFSPERDPDA